MDRPKSPKERSATVARTSREPDNPLRALGWMAASALGFSLMSVFVKRLAPTIPQFELVFFRSFVNFLIAGGMMLVTRETFRPSGKPLLFLRGLAGFIGVSCLFYAVSRLPLSVASLLNWCSPIFVILFSRLFLHERIRRAVFFWVIPCFLGLILLVRPDFTGGGHELPLTAVSVGLAGAVVAGFAYTAVRAATARTSVNTIIFYFAGTSSLLALPLMLRDFHPPSPAEFSQLVLMGALASGAQYAMTQGYRYAAAGLVSTMSLMNAAFASLFGWLVFSETLAPGQWAGMLLLAAGILLVTRTGLPARES